MVDRDKFSDFSRNVRFLDARIRVTAPTESTEPLPIDFEPGNWDVICQGGKESYDHSKFCGMGEKIDIPSFTLHVNSTLLFAVHISWKSTIPFVH